MQPQFTALALIAVFAWCTPAHAWGADGHKIVADLAERFIAPSTKVALQGLLDRGQRLRDIASWADAHRTRCRGTSTWHYVNIPVGAAAYDAKHHCPEADGCVVRAIQTSEAVLRDSAQARDDRALALRYLVHFVGDLHQPLHSGDRSDRGGNDVRVRFDGKSTNLHRVWDYDLIEWTGRKAADYADMLARSLEAAEQRKFQRGDAIAWAEEAQRVARRAYAKIPRKTSTAKPAVLGDAYASAMLPALDEQLLRAGVRLAFALDRALSPGGPPAGEAALAELRSCR